MALALKRNRDLVRSALRLQQASLMVGRTELDLWPKLSGNLGTSVQQPLQSALRNASNLAANTSSGSLAGALEFDLWGRVSQNNVLALQDAQLARTELLAARWLLTTQVAEQYWSLAVIDAKTPFLTSAIEDAQASLQATQLRLRLGKATPSDEHRALTALSEARQRAQNLHLQRDNVLGIFALLLDESSQVLQVAHARLPEHLPYDPTDWPVASVLDRLPSVQRARIALDQSLTKLQIAQSNRYPQLSLSAGLSSSAQQWRQVLSNPLGSLGLGLSLPMFDWKRLGLERDSARLGFDLATTDFREALFKALTEVDNQYNQRQQWLADAQLLQEKTTHAQTALAVARLRHQQGAEPLQFVREAQGSLRELEILALDTRLKAWLNQVAIYKAWGGPLD